MSLRPIHPVHAPGWEHRARDGRTYTVWAPRPDRPRWAACWQDADGEDGDFRRADDRDDALAIFPPRVRGMFRRVST